MTTDFKRCDIHQFGIIINIKINKEFISTRITVYILAHPRYFDSEFPSRSVNQFTISHILDISFPSFPQGKSHTLHSCTSQVFRFRISLKVSHSLYILSHPIYFLSEFPSRSVAQFTFSHILDISIQNFLKLSHPVNILAHPRHSF